MDEVQRAIEWLEAEKASAQNSWERAGAEWRMEPGTQEMHDEQMASFDLAIQALCQMRTESGWIKVSDRLPEKPEHDWVLVHITLSPDGFVGLPHVAELRHGEWFSTEYDLPLEQALLGTVTHWMPLPKKPESEARE